MTTFEGTQNRAKDERCYNKDEALYWFCQLAQHESLRTPEQIGYAF